MTLSRIAVLLCSVSFTIDRLLIFVLHISDSCCYAKCHYAECHYAECHYAECHYAECHYAECHGATEWFTAEESFIVQAPVIYP